MTDGNWPCWSVFSTGCPKTILGQWPNGTKRCTRGWWKIFGLFTVHGPWTPGLPGLPRLPKTPIWGFWESWESRESRVQGFLGVWESGSPISYLGTHCLMFTVIRSKSNWHILWEKNSLHFYFFTHQKNSLKIIFDIIYSMSASTSSKFYTKTLREAQRTHGIESLT